MFDASVVVVVLAVLVVVVVVVVAAAVVVAVVVVAVVGGLVICDGIVLVAVVVLAEPCKAQQATKNSLGGWRLQGNSSRISSCLGPLQSPVLAQHYIGKTNPSLRDPKTEPRFATEAAPCAVISTAQVLGLPGSMTS